MQNVSEIKREFLFLCKRFRNRDDIDVSGHGEISKNVNNMEITVLADYQIVFYIFIFLRFPNM